MASRDQKVLVSTSGFDSKKKRKGKQCNGTLRNSQDRRTPLIAASSWGFEEVAQALVAARADVHAAGQVPERATLNTHTFGGTGRSGAGVRRVP